MEDLIEKINAKGRKIQQEKFDKDMSLFVSVEKDYKAAKSLSPRINKLWDICQALLDNGFRLGEPHYWAGSTYYELETEGWYHWLGFELRNGSTGKQIIAFGVHGGGCCGRSVFIDRKGRIGKFGSDGYTLIEDNIDDSCYISQGDLRSPKKGNTYQDPDFTDKLKEIVNGFDEYERKVMEYANSIVNS